MKVSDFEPKIFQGGEDLMHQILSQKHFREGRMASTLFTSCTISRGTEEEIQVSLIMMIMMIMVIMMMIMMMMMMMMLVMAMMMMMFRCEASAPPWSDNF